MVWEVRNGRRYYYRKTRVGRRVKSIYVGAGRLAKLSSDGDAAKRIQRLHRRRVVLAVKKDTHKSEKELENVYTLIHALTSSMLLINGYHLHKGQWRKMRNESNY